VPEGHVSTAIYLTKGSKEEPEPRVLSILLFELPPVAAFKVLCDDKILFILGLFAKSDSGIHLKFGGRGSDIILSVGFVVVTPGILPPIQAAWNISERVLSAMKDGTLGGFINCAPALFQHT
jgi:hypothetical protein